MAEVNVLVDVGLVEADQHVPVTLGAVQQGAQLAKKGGAPLGIGSPEQFSGLLPRQAEPVQGRADRGAKDGFDPGAKGGRPSVRW